jgi:hypothetical protein
MAVVKAGKQRCLSKLTVGEWFMSRLVL